MHRLRLAVTMALAGWLADVDLVVYILVARTFTWQRAVQVLVTQALSADASAACHFL